MKNAKMPRLLCILLIMSFFLQGCVSPIVKYRHPITQPNSVWSTKDGSITFCIGTESSDHVYGSMETADGPMELGIAMGFSVSYVAIFYAEDMRNMSEDNPQKGFAGGHAKTISKSEYQIEIAFADAWFEPGQIVTFYRVEDGL